MIQQWCASTLQFPHVTGLQTTFTDYFLHNTKYLLLVFFFYSYNHGVYTNHLITLIKTIVFFHAG